MERFEKIGLIWALLLGSTLLLNIVPSTAELGLSYHISSSGSISNASESSSWLHISGVYIYNSVGKRINLHAVNIQYGGGDQEMNLSDIQRIKSLGFNTLRLGLYWRLMQPYNETLGGIDQSYFTTAKAPLGVSVDQAISWAVQENMYVIVLIAWTETWTPPSWAFSGVQNYDKQFTALFNGTATREKTVDQQLLLPC